jgi:hypothetical protein
MPTIVTNTDFMKKNKYVKFRYSNNNNSTDTSTIGFGDYSQQHGLVKITLQLLF